MLIKVFTYLYNKKRKMKDFSLRKIYLQEGNTLSLKKKIFIYLVTYVCVHGTLNSNEKKMIQIDVLFLKVHNAIFFYTFYKNYFPKKLFSSLLFFSFFSPPSTKKCKFAKIDVHYFVFDNLTLFSFLFIFFYLENIIFVIPFISGSI